MSLIKDLKEKTDNNSNLVEILQVMYPDLKTKYYELLVKLMENDITKSGDKNPTLSPFQMLVSLAIKQHLSKKLGEQTWERFVDYNERNLIKENDLTKYKSYHDVTTQVKSADMVVEMKKLESEVVKIIETDEWLVIKPLSHRASVKYGYGTKWCTAMQDRVSYFDEYTSNGMLIYCINKKTNDKVALHKKISGGSELSWWDVTDKRVDLLEINIPNDVIDAIRKDITSNKKTNAMLKIELDKKNGNTSKSVVEDLKTLSINDISNLVVRPTNDNSDLYRRALALMDRM